MHTSVAVLFKKILLTVGVFFGVVFCGILLMLLVYALPTERINIHVKESGISLQQEGNYWYMLPRSPYTVLDNYTDAAMLLTAACDQSGGNLFQKAVENCHIVIRNATLPQSCALLDSAEEMGYALHAYARYWHGYLVYLKPLLMFLNIDEIRQLNWLGVMGAIMATGILLNYRKKTRYLFPYLLFICFMNPGTITSSLQNSNVFYTASTGIILLLLLCNKKKFNDHIWLFFMIYGMLTSYLDLLTYPIVCLGALLIFWLILFTNGDCPKSRKAVSIFGHMVFYSSMWVLGYIGMWSAKWVLASWITGENIIQDALDSFRVRSGNVVSGETITQNDLYKKLWFYMSISRIWTITLLFVLLCVITLCFCRKRWHEWPLTAAFLVIALYPVLWGVCTPNHTYIHDAVFTHRNWGLTIFGLSCSLLPLIGTIKLKNGVSP